MVLVIGQKNLYTFLRIKRISSVKLLNSITILLYFIIYKTFLIHKYNGLYRFDEADEKEIYIYIKYIK